MESKGRDLREVGSYKIGDKFSIFGKDFTVSGIGKTFRKKIPDEDCCCWGLPPGEDRWIEVQYIYYV